MFGGWDVAAEWSNRPLALPADSQALRGKGVGWGEVCVKTVGAGGGGGESVPPVRGLV